MAFRLLVENNCDLSVKCFGTPVPHLLIRTGSQATGTEFCRNSFLLLIEKDFDFSQRVRMYFLFRLLFS
jgi:hypothetical protein